MRRKASAQTFEGRRNRQWPSGGGRINHSVLRAAAVRPRLDRGIGVAFGVRSPDDAWKFAPALYEKYGAIQNIVGDLNRDSSLIFGFKNLLLGSQFLGRVLLRPRDQRHAPQRAVSDITAL